MRGIRHGNNSGKTAVLHFSQSGKITIMPVTHIPDNMYPITEGVLRLTESVKSFIQSAGLLMAPTAAPPKAVPASDMEDVRSE